MAPIEKMGKNFDLLNEETRGSRKICTYGIAKNVTKKENLSFIRLCRSAGLGRCRRIPAGISPFFLLLRSPYAIDAVQNSRRWCGST